MCNAELQNRWMVFITRATQKAEKTESTIIALQESFRRYDRDFQTFQLLRQLYAT